MKHPVCQYTDAVPSFPPSQVHVMLWERCQEADTLTTATPVRSLQAANESPPTPSAPIHSSPDVLDLWPPSPEQQVDSMSRMPSTTAQIVDHASKAHGNHENKATRVHGSSVALPDGSVVMSVAQIGTQLTTTTVTKTTSTWCAGSQTAATVSAAAGQGRGRGHSRGNSGLVAAPVPSHSSYAIGPQQTPVAMATATAVNRAVPKQSIQKHTRIAIAKDMDSVANRLSRMKQKFQQMKASRGIGKPAAAAVVQSPEQLKSYLKDRYSAKQQGRQVFAGYLTSRTPPAASGIKAPTASKRQACDVKAPSASKRQACDIKAPSASKRQACADVASAPHKVSVTATPKGVPLLQPVARVRPPVALTLHRPLPQLASGEKMQPTVEPYTTGIKPLPKTPAAPSAAFTGKMPCVATCTVSPPQRTTAAAAAIHIPQPRSATLMQPPPVSTVTGVGQPGTSVVKLATGHWPAVQKEVPAAVQPSAATTVLHAEDLVSMSVGGTATGPAVLPESAATAKQPAMQHPLEEGEALLRLELSTPTGKKTVTVKSQGGGGGVGIDQDQLKVVLQQICETLTMQRSTPLQDKDEQGIRL